jgi:Ca2+-binding RTX toxin-like protein
VVFLEAPARIRRPTVTANRLLPTLLIAAALLAVPPALAEARVTITFQGQVLTITSGKGADSVNVICNAAGQVEVNHRMPSGGPVPCSKIVEVDAVMGDGNDKVNFSGIDDRFGKAEFPGFGTGTGAGAQGSGGRDTLIGSATAFNLFLGGLDNDNATGGNLRDQLDGGAGDDDLRGLADRDSLLGRAGADRLIGGAGADLLNGGLDDDRLAGSGGADIIGGDAGMDLLLGGPGPDRLLGGPGRDRLRGGGGNDVEIEKRPRPKK